MVGVHGMLNQVISLVRDVGDNVVMPYFLKVARQRKDDGSVLTEADLAAQAALEVGLKAIFECPLVGEEMTAEEQRQNWDAGAAGLWCVDPIDGTSNFVNGLPYFAISVAYMQQGRPLLAVVYAPATREMFFAETGKGAYLNSDVYNKARLPLVRGTASLQEAIAEIDFKRLPKSLALAIATHPPFHSQRNYGSSALDWCYLAAGRFDIYLHGGQKLWDYAAACLILQETGGQMRTLANNGSLGKDLSCKDSLDKDSSVEAFWAGDLWQKSVVAARDADLFNAWNTWLAQYD